MEHRDERADEFLDVSTRLWDSWAGDAVLTDKEAGVHADKDRVRQQAGCSEDGKEFAVRCPTDQLSDAAQRGRVGETVAS